MGQGPKCLDYVPGMLWSDRTPNMLTRTQPPALSRAEQGEEDIMRWRGNVSDKTFCQRVGFARVLKRLWVKWPFLEAYTSLTSTVLIWCRLTSLTLSKSFILTSTFVPCLREKKTFVLCDCASSVMLVIEYVQSPPRSIFPEFTLCLRFFGVCLSFLRLGFVICF